MPERVHRLLLVRAHVPAVPDQLDLVRLAVDVPGEVLGGPAELQQRLLEVTALRRVHQHGVVVDPRAQHRLHLGAAQHLLQHRPVGRHQDQAVLRVLLQPQPPVPVQRLGDVDEQRVRHGVAAVAQQNVDHLLGVVPGRPCVPQPQRRQPVGVHVLRRPLQLSERRNRLPAVVRVRMCSLEQKRLVRLHDQRPVRHLQLPSSPRPSIVPEGVKGQAGRWRCGGGRRCGVGRWRPRRR